MDNLKINSSHRLAFLKWSHGKKPSYIDESSALYVDDSVSKKTKSALSSQENTSLSSRAKFSFSFSPLFSFSAIMTFVKIILTTDWLLGLVLIITKTLQIFCSMCIEDKRILKAVYKNNILFCWYFCEANKDIKRWKVGSFENPWMENSLRGSQSAGHGRRREKRGRGETGPDSVFSVAIWHPRHQHKPSSHTLRKQSLPRQNVMCHVPFDLFTSPSWMLDIIPHQHLLVTINHN